MSIGLVVRIALWIFTALVILGSLVLLVIDMMDKVESLKTKLPWMRKILERRSAFVALLLICVVLLIGDGYELLKKEIPDIVALPPITFASPASPHLTIHQLPQPLKEQCWISNYAVPPIPTPAWGLATMLCNTTIKPPYSIELNYDQSVTVGPITFPVGSEFSKADEFNQGAKIVAMFDVHTIIPNEPFSIMASGATGKFPLVKTAIIRAKGRVFEFHP